MRKLVILILVVGAFSASAQMDWKHVAIKSGLLFTSGFCDGTSEVLKVKYERFEAVHPNCNDQYWDYNVSWTNKYSTYPHERFPMSTTALVWTTDGYHMMRMVRNCTMITAVVIPLHGKKNWKQYVLEGCMYYISYTGGFNLAYDVIYK